MPRHQLDIVVGCLWYSIIDEEDSTKIVMVVEMRQRNATVCRKIRHCLPRARSTRRAYKSESTACCFLSLCKFGPRALFAPRMSKSRSRGTMIWTTHRGFSSTIVRSDHTPLLIAVTCRAATMNQHVGTWILTRRSRCPRSLQIGHAWPACWDICDTHDGLEFGRHELLVL